MTIDSLTNVGYRKITRCARNFPQLQALSFDSTLRLIVEMT